MARLTNIKASIIINASPEQVWQALTDFENLKSWSSSFQGLQGRFEENGDIEVVFKSPFVGQNRMKKKLFHFEEGQSFGWTGIFLFGMSDYHIHTLKALSDGRTEFIQTDGLQGGVSFLLGKTIEKQMQKEYEVFNQELKIFVENKIILSDE
ncbi:SRPBCC domain-containing protein [Labilibaculum euxinus]